VTERAPVVSESALERIADLWRGAWLEATPQAFERCCTPDVQYEDPITSDPIDGVGALAAHADRCRQAVPDMRLERSARCVVEGAFGCIPWRLVGNHRGEVASVPATDRFLVLHGVHYVELIDGRVRRARGFFDVYDAGVQLGLLPKRGSLTEVALLLLRGFGLRPRP
jgi:steroid delta-isomerase-like uncharacterized protein